MSSNQAPTNPATPRTFSRNWSPSARCRLRADRRRRGVGRHSDRQSDPERLAIAGLLPLGFGACRCSCSSSGVIYLVSMPPAGTVREEADRLRICLLVVLGGVGLLTALLGFVLPFGRPPLSVTELPGYFRRRRQGMAQTRERLGLGPPHGGADRRPGPHVRRSDPGPHLRAHPPNLRRLLYGYNAIFSSILLILIIGPAQLAALFGRPAVQLRQRADRLDARRHPLPAPGDEKSADGT